MEDYTRFRSYEHCPFAEEEEEFLEKRMILIILFNF
jgi:hypothetical protein